MRPELLKKGKAMVQKSLSLLVQTVLVASLFSSCASTGNGGGGEVPGNEAGSQPVNPKETIEYQKAVLKCYKTGGSRVVKITGELRCF